MHRATQADVPAIIRFLEAHIESSMFPLTNLMEHGLDGTHERSVSAWIAPDARGVLLVTRNGMLQPQLPCPEDWKAAARIIRGRKIVGCTAETAQAHGMLAAAGLTDRPTELLRDEPLMHRALSDLPPHPPMGELRPLGALDQDLAISWRAHYQQEVLGADPRNAKQRAKHDVAHQLAQNSHRALFIDGTPVAVTGFNAMYRDTVQIGGVYTPPDHRGHRYAGAALLHHLQEAATNGKRTAILFAASESARRAYQHAGFHQSGSYTLCVLRQPETAQ